MKKTVIRTIALYLCLAFLLALLPETAAFAAEEIEINEDNFPDDLFRARVSACCDGDGDGRLSAAELAAVTCLDCTQLGLESLEGVGFFPALTELWCGGNRLTALDLSRNTALVSLYCADNPLTRLDLSRLEALDELFCWGTALERVFVNEKAPLRTVDKDERTRIVPGYAPTEPPRLLAQPRSVSVKLGSSAVFSVSATGEGLEYDWQFRSPDGDDWVSVRETEGRGQNTPTLCVPAVASRNGWQFRCRISNDAGSSYSKPADLTVTLLAAQPVITEQPRSAAASGVRVRFSVTALGPSLRYQWQVKTPDGWRDVTDDGCSGMQTATLTVPAEQARDGFQFRCRVYNGAGSVLSRAAVLTVPATALAIDEEHFPDARFRAYLLENPEIDQNGDAALSMAELADTRYINCDGLGIESLQGIAFFPALQYLSCSDNDLTALDLSENRALVSVGCENNRLIRLELPKNAALRVLDCANNRLPALDLSGCSRLESLHCYGNRLSVIQVNDCPGLKEIWLDSNGVTTNRQEETLFFVIPRIVAELKLDGKSDFEKIEAIYHWLGRNVRYDTTHLRMDYHPMSTAYGALENRTAICIGYANAFTRLLWAVGIPSCVIHGTADNGQRVDAHAWNIVRLDGLWYCCDATWDAVYEERFFLKSETSFSDHMPADDYLTEDFRAAHPMAETDYRRGDGPTITQHPANVTAEEGTAASFSVSSGDEVLRYQWQVKTGDGWSDVTNRNCSGMQSETLTVPATSTRNGYEYRCALTNAEGTSYSCSATLTIGLAPAIVVQPASQTAAPGTSVAFTVEASGGDALNYQWQVKTEWGWVNVTHTSCSGMQTETLIVPATDERNANQYRCRVSNASGAVLSNVATLTVGGAQDGPYIVRQPCAVTTAPGTTAHFSVKAEGENLVYQWQIMTGKGWVNVTNTSCSGMRTPNLSVPAAESRSGRQYRCKIYNASARVYSAPALLTVDAGQARPAIEKQPVSVTARAGTTARFTVTARGAGLFYRWQEKTADGWADLTDPACKGAKSAALSVPATTDNDGRRFRCLIFHKTGAVCSETVRLRVATKPVLIVQPESLRAKLGTTAVFSVTASGTALCYQWQVKTDEGWVDVNNRYIEGETEASMRVPATAARDGFRYRCVVSNAAGVTYSSPVTLTVAG